MSRVSFSDFGSRLQKLTLPVTKELFRALSTPYSLQALEQLERGETALVLWVKANPPNPEDYGDSNSFAADYLVYNFLRKFPFGGTDGEKDRRETALRGFAAAEEACRVTNEFYTSRRWLENRRFGEVMFLAKRKIGECLADTDFSVESLAHQCRFGPGASLTLPRRKGDVYYKLGNKNPAVSPGGLAVVEAVLGHFPMWVNHMASLKAAGSWRLMLSAYNKITTVPKDAVTDRVIAIEPDLNMFVQRAVGRLLRQSLKRKGVDLDHGFRRNRVLALQGSLNGDYATLDLSAASDTISYEVVKELLPPDVFDLLDCLRSTHYRLASRVEKFEKFSTMGNGFTFELESLIFWAICSACNQLSGCGSHDLAVYGDDLIVPRQSAGLVVESLELAGFEVNKRKSFVDGPFRESCGGHYFLGRDVTPIYVKSDIDSPARYVWLANSLRRWGSARQIFGSATVVKSAYDVLVGALPRRYRRPRVPLFHSDGTPFADIALGGDFDEVLPSWSKDLQQYVVTGVAESRKTFLPDDDAILLKALYSLECGAPGDVARVPSNQGSGVSIPLQDRVRWVHVRIPVGRWGAVGPWI